MAEEKRYNQIFLPLPDVYRLGGRDVFTNLTFQDSVPGGDTSKVGGKNLIALTTHTIDILADMNETNYGGGVHDVLKFLKRANSSWHHDAESNISTWSCSDGLDVALLSFEDRPEIEDIGTRIKEICGDDPTIITSEEKYHIKFGAKKLKVEDPKFLQVNSDIVNEGIIIGSADLQEALHQKGSIPLDVAVSILGRDLFMHQWIKFPGAQPDYAHVTGKFVRSSGNSRIIDVREPVIKLYPRQEYEKRLHVAEHSRGEVLGISPRDFEQYLAMQYGLLNEDVSMFFLCGSQGSGKTLLAYVCAVDLCLWYDKQVRELRMGKGKGKGGFYKQMVVLKPNEILGGKRRDPGTLPGDLYKKTKPHLGPYIDSHRESELANHFPFEVMLKHPRFPNEYYEPREEQYSNAKIGDSAHLSPNNEVIEMTHSAYMRGRSFSNTILIIDETQNFTPYEVKTVIERLGEGCKIILLGDPAQVDNPHCSREINGLTHAIKHYLPRPYSALVTLSKNYRSQMSEDATGWRVYSS